MFARSDRQLRDVHGLLTVAGARLGQFLFGEHTRALAKTPRTPREAKG
jgi:hypothetical protein